MAHGSKAVPLEILGSSPGSVAAGRDRETHWATHNRPSVVRVRGGLMGIVSRTSAAWLGCVSEDARLSTLASPESVQELQQ